MRTQHPEEGFAYLSEKAHKVCSIFGNNLLLSFILRAQFGV